MDGPIGFLLFAIQVTNISQPFEDNPTHATAYYRTNIQMPIINGFLAASTYIVVCMTIDR